MNMVKNIRIIIVMAIVIISLLVTGGKVEAKTRNITVYVDQPLPTSSFMSSSEKITKVSKSKLVSLEGEYDFNKWIKTVKQGKGTIKIYTKEDFSNKKRVYTIKLKVKKNPIKYEIIDMTNECNIRRARKKKSLKITNPTNMYADCLFTIKYYDSDGILISEEKDMETGFIAPNKTVYIDFNGYYDLDNAKVEKLVALTKAKEIGDYTNKVQLESREEGNEIISIFKTAYKGKKTISVYYYYTEYDMEGNVVGHGKNTVLLTKEQPIAKISNYKVTKSMIDPSYYTVYDYYKAYIR